ncbi:MAG: Holliday junction branch migration protein RuvA [Clostridia bacterium]|nr:Holliday junction branch migration protein RuvA [Clostridia bacterium]
MIYCLTGEVLYFDALTNTAVIDCGGVGYGITAPESTIAYLGAVPAGEKVRVHTYTAVREDAVELYGFKTAEELRTFKILISVSGVGPKAAIAILSVLTPTALSYAISSGDIKAISAAQGIGKRIAERIVLELKDKLGRALPDADNSVASPSSAPAVAKGGSLADARDALIVLGYSRSEVDMALKGADAKAETEDLIRQALLKLMK